MERYLNRKGLSRKDQYPYSTYAMLGDQGWESFGDIGWFGISANNMEEREWQDKIQAFLAGLPDETFLVSVDCHI